MRGLLKADFKRITKDKLLLVMGILAVAFALLTPLLYALLFSGAGFEDEPLLEVMLPAKNQFFASFSLGNNLGLIAPVLLGIALCKDFSFGTIRNKIIAGKSRKAIYMSLFITCATVIVGVILVHALITLGVSLIFFPYQPTPFTLWDFWYLLASVAFDILTLLWVAALLTYLCANAKNVGLVIVLYIAITFALVIVGSIITVVHDVLKATGGNEGIVKVLHFIDRINVANSATYIGMGNGYTLGDILYLTIPALVGIAGFTGLGLARFSKKDLK